MLTACEQVRYLQCCREQPFEVIQQEEQTLVAQRSLHQIEQWPLFGFLEPKGVGDRGNYQSGVAQGS